MVSPLKPPAQSSENKGKKNCQKDQRRNSVEMNGRHVKTRGSWRELVCERKVMPFSADVENLQSALHDYYGLMITLEG